jgi:transcriptional regulator with XRE-family HTH domain
MRDHNGTNPILTMGNFAQAPGDHTWDKTHMTTTVARNLKRLRDARGLNAKKLSKLAKVGETYVRDIEQGRSIDPRSEKLARVAAVLEVTVEALISSDDIAETPVDIIDAPTAPEDPAEDDEHFATICEAAASLLKELGAAHNAREAVRLGFRMRDAILAFGPGLPFEQRLEMTISEERPRIRQAMDQMLDRHQRRPLPKRRA